MCLLFRLKRKRNYRGREAAQLSELLLSNNNLIRVSTRLWWSDKIIKLDRGFELRLVWKRPNIQLQNCTLELALIWESIITQSIVIRVSF